MRIRSSVPAGRVLTKSALTCPSRSLPSPAAAESSAPCAVPCAHAVRHRDRSSKAARTNITQTRTRVTPDRHRSTRGTRGAGGEGCGAEPACPPPCQSMRSLRRHRWMPTTGRAQRRRQPCQSLESRITPRWSKSTTGLSERCPALPAVPLGSGGDEDARRLQGCLRPARHPVRMTGGDPLEDTAKVVRSRQFGDGNLVANLTEDLGHRHPERFTDACQQLGRGFLLAAFHLGEIAKRHPRGLRHLAKGASLPLPMATKDIAEQATEQDHLHAPPHGLRSGRLAPPPYLLMPTTA